MTYVRHHNTVQWDQTGISVCYPQAVSHTASIFILKNESSKETCYLAPRHKSDSCSL